MIKRLFILLVLTLDVFGGAPERPAPSGPPPEERTLGDIARFFAAIESADSVTIYEGLPHQGWERALHESELGRADIVRFEGYPFYAKPLELPAKEIDELTRIASRRAAHVPFGGYKLCGGYHPDYAIIWTKHGKRSGSLVCFGCHEWKNFTPAGRLYEDIEPSAYAELKSILTKYRVNRPKQPAVKAE